MAARNRVFDWIVVIISFLSMWFISSILFDCNDKWCCCCYDSFFCSAFFSFTEHDLAVFMAIEQKINLSTATKKIGFVENEASRRSMRRERANVLSLVKFCNLWSSHRSAKVLSLKKKQFAQTAMDSLRAPLICFSLFCAASQSRRISIISAIKS